MKKLSNKIVKINFIIIIIILILTLIVGILIVRKIKTDFKEKDEQSLSKSIDNSNDKNQNDFKRIRLNEDISKEGKIENIENIRWNSAKINQFDDEMEITIDIEKELKNQKVESKILTINLLDKEGKIIATKDVQMEEIPEDKNYIRVKIEFEVEEPILIYDIQIIAK